jgi:hypothetical protein
VQGVLAVPLRGNVRYDDSTIIVHYLRDAHPRRIVNRQTELISILRRHIFSIRILQTELLLASILLNHVYEYRIHNIYLHTNKDVCVCCLYSVFVLGIRIHM